MSYSITQRQECSLCVNRENPVGIFKKESLQRGIFEEQKGTFLKCKHAFHDACIRKHFDEGQTNCPNCLIEVAESDRVYTLNEEFMPKRESSYPDTQHGQVCTICFDDDDLVGKFEKTSLEGGTFHEQKGTVLKCKHAFHDACIRKHFYGNNTNCPTCHTEIDKKDLPELILCVDGNFLIFCKPID